MAPMALSPDEIERYARHLVMPEIGGPGQQRLKQSNLLVIGAGGLGTPVISYCAAAGIGGIRIVDPDVVALANLQRQVIYRSDEIGMAKAERATAMVRALNPHVAVEGIIAEANAETLPSLLDGIDIVADCTDNAAARYTISDACFHASTTLVSAAVLRMDGNVTTLKPHQRASDGTPNPTYRCLFPEPPEDGANAACAELGVLGVMTGLLGSIQALEVIKECAGIGASLIGRLLLVDGRDLRFETIDYRWNPANALNGLRAIEPA